MKTSAKLLSLLIAVTPIASYAAVELPNTYKQTNLVANKDIYKAEEIDEKLVNAWGIAIRPAGAGGHFWVGGKDMSFEYVGDVKNAEDTSLRKLHTDDLEYVSIPVGGEDAYTTGIVFSGSEKDFVITQQAGGTPITAPAKFLFASDGGIISAWTERKKADGSKDFPFEAVTVIDGTTTGAAYFGIAMNSDYSRLYAADFGSTPNIEVYDRTFKALPIKFDMPFDDNKNGLVDAGEYAPFNIQNLNGNLFVAYAKTQACPAEEVKAGGCKKGEIFAAEEDTSNPGQGRIAEFTEEGKLVAVWQDDGKLSAPWGMAIAPDNFGKLSNALLVANFGDGTIAAYSLKDRKFIDYMRDESGMAIEIKQIWGLIFGNGASLGDTNALYFSAGPDDEKDGLFGSLRFSEKK